MKSLGLALGGGGLKGFAHIGVLQVLLENNIPVFCISGTSAGSLIAALYASGMSPYSMQRLILDLKPSDYIDYNIWGFIKFFLSLYIPSYYAPLNGLVKGERIENLVFEWTHGKKLSEVSMPLAITACDIDNGKEVIFTNLDFNLENRNIIIIKDALLSEAVRASISIPVTFIPRTIQGMQMVDGGVREIVPVNIQLAMGAEYVLAVNLGEETYEHPVSGLEQIIKRTVSILTYETSKDDEKLFADMIIYPGVASVNLTDLEKAPFIIRKGRKAMLQQIVCLKRELMD